MNKLKMSTTKWTGCWRADYERSDETSGEPIRKTFLFEWLNNPHEKLTVDEVIFCIISKYGFKKVKVLKIYYQ